VTPLARVHDEQGEDVVVAAIEGEIDASNAIEIGARLRALVTNQSSALVVDLSDTTYLDSAGLNLLFELAAELEHRQLRLRVVVPPSSPIVRTMRLVGMEGVIPTHATRAEALETQG
jgi:anti-sigma B factor antagonist